MPGSHKNSNRTRLTNHGATRANMSTVFKFAEHVFDCVAAFIERLVECNLHVSAALWRDAWGNARRATY